MNFKVLESLQRISLLLILITFPQAVLNVFSAKSFHPLNRIQYIHITGDHILKNTSCDDSVTWTILIQKRFFF